MEIRVIIQRIDDGKEAAFVRIVADSDLPAGQAVKILEIAIKTITTITPKLGEGSIEDYITPIDRTKLSN